jgi:peptide/nickel transport system substrate-binding protein
VAQFKAGNIWSTVHRNEDMLPAKKENPALNLLQGADFPKTPWSLTFGYEGNSPFKDERMRQAVSMLIDREAVIDVIAGRPGFQAEGIEMPVRYATVVGAGWEGYWLDPQDEKKFGPNAKFYKTDVAEAKKLISAAGFGSGVDTSWFYSAGQIYGAAYAQVSEMVPGMLAEGGIRAKAEPKEYGTDWLPNYYYGYANANKGFNGVMFRGEQTYPTMGTQFFATFHKSGPRFVGVTDTGNNAQQGDPKLNSDIEKIRAEFDVEKQRTLVQDLIRYMAGKSYNIPTGFPVSTPALSLQWPVIGNLGVYNGSTGSSSAGELGLNLWIDPSKQPLGTG